MGASGSKVGPRPPSSHDEGEETINYMDGIEPPWSLPPASQDAVWTKVQLSTILAAGTAAQHVMRAASGWGGVDDGNMRSTCSTQAARLARHTPPLQNEDDSEDWLEAGLCFSMSSLPRDDMATLVERAKGQLLRKLSHLCDQDDIFCEAVMQRIHALYCVHAAMTRRRVLQAKRTAAAIDIGLGEDANQQHNNEQPAGQVEDILEPSGEARLGLQLFFSLLDFVQDPECGQEQITDFLQQIVPVLSSLPQLCLASWYTPDDDGQSRRAKPASAPGVVHALREFLVRCIVPTTRCNGLGQAEVGESQDSDQEGYVLDAGQQDIAFSALVGLVAARGRASDLLVLVKVLLDITVSGEDADVDNAEDEGPMVCLEGDGQRRNHVLTECSAKRFATLSIHGRLVMFRCARVNLEGQLWFVLAHASPCRVHFLASSLVLVVFVFSLSSILSFDRRPISHAKARRFRQGLPVGDDDENGVCDSPLLTASGVVAKEINPADPTIGCDAVDDLWDKKQAKSCILGACEGGKTFESHAVKRKTFKGERIKPALSSDPESWQVIERTASNQVTPSQPRIVVHANLGMATKGIESRYILPFLRHLQDAKPDGCLPLDKVRNPIHQREVWTCGQNSYGELGHSDTGTRKTFCVLRALEGIEIVDVAAGSYP